MTKIRNFFAGVVSLVLAVVPVGGVLATLNVVHADEFTPVTIHNVYHVDVNGMNRNQLFDFVTNIQNDHNYWVGVDSTVLVQAGDPQDLTGTQYIQQGTFGGFPFNTAITITEGKNHKYIKLVGTSPLLSYTATYSFENVGDDTQQIARFTGDSLVTGIGLSPEFLTFYIQTSLGSLLNTLGTTGTVSVDLAEVI